MRATMVPDEPYARWVHRLEELASSARRVRQAAASGVLPESKTAWLDSLVNMVEKEIDVSRHDQQRKGRQQGGW